MNSRRGLTPVMMVLLCAALVTITSSRRLLFAMQPGESPGLADQLADAVDALPGILPAAAYEPPRAGAIAVAPVRNVPSILAPLARHDGARSPPLSA